MAFVPTTRPEVETWLLRFHGVNDSLDASKLADIYAKDAKVQFGNLPLIEGLDALSNFFTGTWAKLDFMHHEIDSFDLVDDKIYQQCHITWQVKNDPEKEKVVVPAFGVLHLCTSGKDKGLVRRAEFYMDSTPLAAALQRSS